MHPIFLLAAAAPVAVADESRDETIVVTASLEPVAEPEAGASATVFDEPEIEALALPFAADILRLSPGVSIASTGPKGTQTQLRIRGAEANHSLLFVDGIRFNDPAAGNEARFELLTADGVSRIEVVRGPQSALWGSEALGGVIAIDGPDPLRRRSIAGLAEYGSLDSARASVDVVAGGGRFGLSASAGRVRSDGIDSFGAGGERDGFDNRHARLAAVYKPLPAVTLGVVGHWIDGESEYDGLDPVTFRRSDTLDSTVNRIRAARAWAAAESGGWTLKADASWLDSDNRNRLAGLPLNRTAGSRFTAGAQLSRRLAGHRLVVAVEHEAEDFEARDPGSLGAADQDRSRSLSAVVAEWRAEWSSRLATDVAVRHDDFSVFHDSTTLRGSAIFRLADGWRAHAAYGEGIAQPTFYDLYGFFPGSFVGNPGLKPERSKGLEAGLRWTGGKGSAGITGFAARLEDEIVETFDLTTFLAGVANASGTSRRKGVEADAEYRPNPAVRLAFNYTFLEADERKVAGVQAVRELRRPRHSAAFSATGASGPLSWSASAAFVGKRRDTDFDLFPGRSVTLDDYWLASLKLGWRVTRELEAYARVENAFGADYQDVVGYNTPGRTVYAGIRLRFGD